MDSLTSFAWRRLLPALLLVGTLSACDDQPEATGPIPAGPRALAEVPAAGDLVTVGGFTFWPFTAHTPSADDPADPVQFVLTGEVDPRLLRARLLFLDGDRSAFGMPASAFPLFGCTWEDGHGQVQGAWAEESGWSGSAIQLVCGTYQMRFHIRLFRFEEHTLVAAHMDLQMGSSPDHQVISWELAEAFLLADLMRLGASPSPVPGMYVSPTWRSIDPLIWGAIPTDLKGFLQAFAGVASDGTLGSDGTGWLVNISAGALAPPGQAEVARQRFTIQFDEIIPRPFCEEQGPEYIHVRGPVVLDQHVVFTPGGTFTSHLALRAHLEATPVDPMTGEPIGETYKGTLNERSRTLITDSQSLVSAFSRRMEIRSGKESRGILELRFRIGPGGEAHVAGELICR